MSVRQGSVRPPAGASRGFLLDLFGHRASDALCACIAGAVVIGLWPPPGVLLLVVPVLLVAAVLLSWLAMRQHDRRLCEQCFRAMPLDAARRADRYGTRFACVHLSSNKLAVIGYLTLLVGVNFVPGLVGKVVWAAVQLSLVYLIRAHVAHRRFQPWCKHCHGRGDAELPVPHEPLPRDHSLV